MFGCHEIDKITVKTAWARSSSTLWPIVVWVLDPKNGVSLALSMHLRFLDLLHHQHHLLLLAPIVTCVALPVLALYHCERFTWYRSLRLRDWSFLRSWKRRVRNLALLLCVGAIVGDGTCWSVKIPLLRPWSDIAVVEWVPLLVLGLRQIVRGLWRH